MAGSLKIRKGSKLFVAFDVPIGKEPVFNMICTFGKSLDESAFLVSIPMKNGKPMEVDDSQKLLIRYGDGVEAMIMGGYVDDIVKDGVHRYWKIRRVVEQRQFFVRKDERVKVSLPISYMQDTWPTNAEGVVEPESGSTLDISGGGLAVFLSRNMVVGEICMITLPNIGSTALGKAPENVVGTVCWMREAPKGSPYKRLCGFQFRFEDAADHDKMSNYVNFIKKRYKL